MRLAIPPDQFTHANLLTLAAYQGSLDLGKQIHAYIIRVGIRLNVVVETELVHMFARCNRLREAESIFESMQERNNYSWNSLIDEEEKIYLIDFECGSYSYRGYDIANHFNEYAGLECDYSLYPGREAQYHFLRNYLERERSHEVDDKVLEALYVEANTFKLASHLYWALWAIIQAKVSPIDFDYLSYFFLRYHEYEKQKKDCFSLAKEYISSGSINRSETPVTDSVFDSLIADIVNTFLLIQ